MKNNLHWYLSFLLLLCFSACDDILEPDISEKRLRLLLPADSVALSRADVNFRWEAMEGARSYRLQLASPSFDKPQEYYMDTIVSSSHVSLPLQPGEYEWRVQGLNAGYQTAFAIRHFLLDSASNLSGSVIRIQAPENNAFSNRRKIQFAWDPVALADKYIFEIIAPVPFDTVVYANKVTRSFPQEGKKYTWRVRALNATGSLISDSRQITLDFEAPGMPERQFPRQDTTVFTWPVTLKWNRTAADVAGDSLFLFQSNQTTLVAGFPKRVPDSFFQLTSGLSLTPGNYYWAVKSYDQGGNAGPLTSKFKLTVR